MQAARKGLETALDFCFEQSGRFRRPSSRVASSEGGTVHQPIYYWPPAYLLLSTSLSIKVQLWNEIVAQKVLPTEQARRDALAENSQSTA